MNYKISKKIYQIPKYIDKKKVLRMFWLIGVRVICSHLFPYVLGICDNVHFLRHLHESFSVPSMIWF